MKFLKFLLIILLVPFTVMAEECDLSKITITAMELSGREGEADEVDVPTFQDRNISLNLKLYEVGDSISYNMTIKNDSEEDYMLDEDAFKTDSEYIEYSLRTNDNSNVVKAGSTKELTLVVTYKKEVDDDLLTNNKFDASNNLKLSMNTSKKEQELDVITTDNIKESVDPVEEANPSTGAASLTILVIVLVIMLIVLLTIMQKKKYNKYLILILSMSLIPVVYAVCKCDIEVEATIEIMKKPTLFRTVSTLAKEDNACIVKYEGEVTDEVGKTVEATNVYFDKCEEKRNVIFGGFCWQVIRTSQTGGTKLLYNGEPVDGKCESTRENHKGFIGKKDSNYIRLDREYLYSDTFEYNLQSGSFTLVNPVLATWSDSTYENLLGKYTCVNDTGTCTKIYNVNHYKSDEFAHSETYTIDNTHYSQIGISDFNVTNTSPAMVGYMFNKAYTDVYSLVFPQKLSSSFTYDRETNTYTLSGTIKTIEDWSTEYNTLNNTHYTCGDDSSSCTKLLYVFYSENDKVNYMELTDGKSIEDILDEMLYSEDVNKYSSVMKKLLENWYRQNLLDYSDKIQDTVYCNNRSSSTSNSFDPNGGDTTSVDIISFGSSNLSCKNVTDQFAVGNNKAKLEYPVALIQRQEINKIGKELLFTGQRWYSLSPFRVSENATYAAYSPSFGNYSYVAFASSIGFVDNTLGLAVYVPVPFEPMGVRPVITLKKNALIYQGSGSETNPWIVE